MTGKESSAGVDGEAFVTKGLFLVWLRARLSNLFWIKCADSGRTSWTRRESRGFILTTQPQCLWLRYYLSLSCTASRRQGDNNHEIECIAVPRNDTQLAVNARKGATPLKATTGSYPRVLKRHLPGAANARTSMPTT